MDSEHAIDIEAVIADLEAKKAAIDSTIQALRAVYASGTGSTTPGGIAPQAPQSGGSSQAMDPARIPSTAFFGMRSIGDAAVKYLTLVKRKQTTKQIVDALERGGFPHQSSNLYSAVYVALQRREEQGDVMRIGSEWAMSSWFPGRGRKTEPVAKRTKKRAGKAKMAKLLAFKAALTPEKIKAAG